MKMDGSVDMARLIVALTIGVNLRGCQGTPGCILGRKRGTPRSPLPERDAVSRSVVAARNVRHGGWAHVAAVRKSF